MGVHRDNMLRALQIRGYAEATIELYLAAMTGLVQFHMRAPDELLPADINRYQHYLIYDRQLSYSTLNVAVSAFRFFYRHVVPVIWDVTRLPYHRKPRRLPEILSRDELLRIFEAVANQRLRALLMTIYAGGLRLGEARRLRPEDVDVGRMQLRIRQGKGAKDRYVPLSEVALRVLGPYLAARQRGEWLFPGKAAGKPVDASTVQRTFKRAVRAADIQKEVSVHSMRHAFATHLLEDGAHIRAVQKILGHRSLSTTTIYLHCTESYVRELRSPLDRLRTDQLDADDPDADAAAACC